MGSLKCDAKYIYVPMFFRGAGEGGKGNGFSWVHSAQGLQTGEGPLLCRQRPSVCASGRLGVRPLHVVTTTCYWSTQCSSVFPQCPSWLLVTTGTSEWGLWQGASYEHCTSLAVHVPPHRGTGHRAQWQRETTKDLCKGEGRRGTRGFVSFDSGFTNFFGEGNLP